MADAELLIETERLYRFYGDHCAVRDVGFRLSKGEILGFLGPNGAGKTTTMHMLTGNLAPSAGQIRIAGIDLLDHPRDAKAELGYLPEQPPLYRELTVDEYLRFCARLNRVPSGNVKNAIDSAKHRCGLEATGGRLIGNLSKGFQQRVGIAQAILHNPVVVILDEPTVGLDPIQIREIRALIRELGRDHGIILSTHILPEVQAICTRVQIIHEGALVFEDTTEGLNERLQANSLEAAFFATPDFEVLRNVPGVVEIDRISENRLRIGFSGENPAEKIVALAVEHGWRLHEMTGQRRTLEQIFVELTCGEGPPGKTGL